MCLLAFIVPRTGSLVKRLVGWVHAEAILRWCFDLSSYIGPVFSSCYTKADSSHVTRVTLPL
jgi:hypothetical protein